MVDEYVAWYDRHFDPAWQDILLTRRTALPWGYVVPRSADDLVGMGRCFAATTFLSAGNITHTPAYGHLIALGVLGEVQARNASARSRSTMPRPIAQHIARTGRFLTFSAGAATIGYRMRPDPAERAALRIVRETDSGVVLRGKIGMHTSPAYAEDVYIGAHCGVEYRQASRDIRRAGECAGRHRDLPQRSRRATPIRSRRRSAAATTSWTGRCGSTMCMFRGSACSWWIRRPSRSRAGCSGISSTAGWRRPSSRWAWRWPARMRWGSTSHDATIDYLLDLITDVQTVRSCQIAAERDPQFTEAGYCYPNHCHLVRRQHRHAEGAAAHERDPAHRCLAPRWSSRRPIATSRRPRWPLGWRSRSAAAATARAARRAAADGVGSCRRRRWMPASRRSSCMPMAACRRGAGGCGAASTATTSWPTACCAS